MRRSRTATFTCAGILLVAVGFGSASAQTSPGRRGVQPPPAPSTASPQKAVQPTNDPRFVSQAALANMAEIRLGHLAIKKAQRPTSRSLRG